MDRTLHAMILAIQIQIQQYRIVSHFPLSHISMFLLPQWEPYPLSDTRISEFALSYSICIFSKSLPYKIYPSLKKMELAQVSFSLLQTLLEILLIKHGGGQPDSIYMWGGPRSSWKEKTKHTLASVRETIVPRFWSLLTLSCHLYSQYIYILSSVHLT